MNRREFVRTAGMFAAGESSAPWKVGARHQSERLPKTPAGAYQFSEQPLRPASVPSVVNVFRRR